MLFNLGRRGGKWAPHPPCCPGSSFAFVRRPAVLGATNRSVSPRQPLAKCRHAALAGLSLFAVVSALGQESLRLSLAGAEAARARREAATSTGYYNLKLGPTAWTFAANLGLEANDNIALESVSPRADFIVRPGLNARLLWPLSEVNSFNFALGAGYSAYTQNPEFSRFYVAPGSELSFDFYVGDFWINLHDRLAITENNYQDPTVVGSADYALLQDVLGLAATWDLNHAVLRCGYDHVNYLTLHASAANSPGQPDGQSENFSASAGYRVRPGVLAGLDLGASLLTYTSPNRSFTDASQWNVGSFVEAQLSQYIRGRASVGYTVYTPQDTATSAGLGFQGLYAEIDFTHRLNQYLDYTLNAGHTVNFAFYGGTVDLYFVRWQGNWHFVRKFSLGTSLEYEHGTQLSPGGETFDRFGPGLSLGHDLNRKLSASLSYVCYWRNSDLPGRNYTDNVVTLNGTYQF